jgi:CspA family cold shock protein
MAITSVTTRGTVKWYDPRKGYGFIERQGAPQVFVHYSVIKGPQTELKTGDKVEFMAEQKPQGFVAHNVRVL